MTVLLTYGDSNTHGTPPILELGEYRRFDAATRWPALVGKALGWEVIEEGLPGRTAQFDDPVMGPHMNGQDGLKIALQSHGPIDALTIMLGTNDVKARFGASPELVTGGVAKLLDIAFSEELQIRHGGFKVLLICPPPVVEVGPIKTQFYGGRARSLQLPPLYAGLAEAYGAAFLDAGKHIQVSPIDGVHFDPPAHGVLATAVADKLRLIV